MNALSQQSIRVHDIHGGIHPPENKHQSVQTPIKTAPIPAEIVLPLSQHIGAPARPIVNVGDKVLKGQMIAEANGFVSVPVHASTSGEVVAIEDRMIPHASGMTAPCITIQPDYKDEWTQLAPIEDYTLLDKASLIEHIRQAGISGMGGAGFPAAVKLNTKPEHTIDTLIINGTECEPYITADDILMRERADRIIGGVKILQHIIAPTERTLIGIEDNKPEAIAAMQKAAEGTDIQIVVFPTKYPSGGEKQLIEILTGKQVPSKGLPAEIGIVCQNIGSTVAIYDAIVEGKPLISRITTVTGYACSTQQNYEVLLGTPMRGLLEDSGFDESKASRVIMGGPMMGFAVHSIDVPVVKTTNCLLAPTEKELPTPPPAQACIRCGMCAEACPVSLLPQQLFWFSQAKNHEALEAHNLFDCIECGACSYVCPSNIPLVQFYRASKGEIRQMEEDKKKAEYSKARFEARQARLEKIEAEKEAKRKERQQKAAEAAAAKEKAKQAEESGTEEQAAGKTAPDSHVDPVQAAIERAKAKASGEKVDPIEEAKAKLASLQKRLVKAEEKLANARETNDPNIAAFETALEKLQEKIRQAESQIPKQGSAPSPEPAAADDPVQAAIERAKAKRAGTDEEPDPKTQLQNTIASLEKRLDKSREKLAEARAEGKDTVEVLESSLQKLEDKLADAKKELDALSTETANDQAEEQPPEPAPADDPVQAAIERAKAKRACAGDDTDPKTKLQNDIASLEKRITNAENKLATAEDENPAKADALRASIEKLQEKLASSRDELEKLG